MNNKFFIHREKIKIFVDKLRKRLYNEYEELIDLEKEKIKNEFIW